MDGVENSGIYGNGGCSSDHLTHFPSSSSSHVLESLWIQNASSSFNDPSTVNYSDFARRSLPAPEDNDEDGEDDGSSETERVRNPYRRPEKKRRLAPEQVKHLERSFEVESKLEPERKTHLAKELSLQPRQVAIWFQNRRARFKTKQLEKEFDSLQANFNSLKSDFDSLLKEKERLQNEVSILTNKLKQKEKTGLLDPVQLEAKNEGVKKAVPPFKQEDASSAKSDVSDSESPHCSEENYTSVIEEVMVKPEWLELPPERSFRPVTEYGFGDVFEVHGSGCNLGLIGVEDQSNYWPWLY